MTPSPAIPGAAARPAAAWLLLLLLAGCLPPAAARAGEGDQVVVLYNSRAPGSQAIARHYAALRQVPASQIFGFDLTTNEEMSRWDFQENLQLRLAGRLEAHGLWKFGPVTVARTPSQPARVETRVVASRIRYAVLCQGIPLKIAEDHSGRFPGLPTAPTGLGRNEAAVDSELAWLPWCRTPVKLAGPLPNPAYGCTNDAPLDPTNGLLLVARLDGPSLQIAGHLVDLALQAERDGLWGRAYFDTRGLPPASSYYPGDQWLRNGARVCRLRGFDVETDTNSATFPASFPLSQIAIYAGWYAGDACGPFAQPTVEFMPGAFAYHLFSFSAATLRSATANWCGPLLAKGATCTMGCTYEPYLQLTPNIGVFLARFCAGHTFGEAAWAAQPALSWQTTVIGDPLYRPFNQSPAARFRQLTRERSPLIEWAWEQVINLSLVQGARPLQLEALVENLPVTARSAVLTEKLAELDEACGKPSSAIATWQRALTLHPSPQQRLRIRRTLADRLVAAGRFAEAADDWRQLLAESPDYPGRIIVDEKLRELAARKPAPPP